MALIKTHTLNGTPVTKIAVWCSGGADSSLLLYMLVKENIDRNLNINIIPHTVRRIKPGNCYYASGVVDKIEELLDYTFSEHREFYPDIDWLKEFDPDHPHDSERKFWNMKAKEMRKEFQGIYSGQSETPPRKIMEDWTGLHPRVLEERTPDRSDKSELSDRPKFYTSNPWRNLNKQALAEIYRKEGLLDTLYPITRSCESFQINTGHCGECWWCKERMWAFGRLE